MPSDAPVLAPVRRGRPRVRDAHAHERSQADEMPWRPAPVPTPAVPGRIVPDLPEPFHDAEAVRGMLCFVDERADLEIDDAARP